MKKITTTLMTITPSLANKYLALNIEQQRKTKPANISIMAEAIKAGKWRITGDTIKFNVDGKLIDGQNRLYAVVEANKAIKTYVARNVPNESITVIDTGCARTGQDALKISGFTDTTHEHVSVIAPLLFNGNNGISLKYRLGAQNLVETYSFYKPAIDFAVTNLKGIRQQVKAVIARAYYSVDQKELLRFCTILREGFSSEEIRLEDSGVIKLREFLIRTKGNANSAKGKEIYEKTEFVLNAYLHKTLVTSLRSTKTELYQIPEMN